MSTILRFNLVQPIGLPTQVGGIWMEPFGVLYLRTGHTRPIFYLKRTHFVTDEVRSRVVFT